MDNRKALKIAYKETTLPIGVYQIKNLRNGKLFIGSSANIPGKLNGHRFSLQYKSHINKALQNDWNLYGADAFAFDTLELLKTEEVPAENRREALVELEDKWKEKLQPYGENGYNKPTKG